MWKPDICVHHFPCDDGFAAAWIAKKKWPEIECFGTNYGQPFPDVDITGKNVLIADFSFKPDVLAELADKARSIVILDHHKTAEADLKDLHAIVRATHDNVGRCFARMSGTWRERVLAEFDMKRSGAMMTWDFCFPTEEPYPLIRYVEDRDLWRFAIDHTRAVSLYLRSFPYDFDAWTEVAERTAVDLEAVLAEARAIERFYDRKLAELIPTAVRFQSIGGHTVPVLNVPWALASDAAHELLIAHPDAPFAAAYFDNGGGRTYSLRSENTREDVSTIARQYGGGGHRNAAGFRMPL